MRRFPRSLGSGAPVSAPAAPASLSAYQTAVLADGPVAYWPLNELTGTTAVDYGSGTPANGTYTGGFTLGRPGIDGASGGTSVLLNGSSGYVDVGAVPAKLAFTGNFTIEAWCAFGLAPGITAPGAALVTEAFAGDGTVRYMLGFHNGSNNGKRATWGWYNGSWRLVTSSTTDLDDGNWHHCVGTYDAGANQLELWVDAVSQGTLTPGGSMPVGSESLYFGRRWDGGAEQYFNGWLDQVAMYGVKLSSTQIATHYGARAPSPPGARVSQELVEGLVYVASPNVRVSQVMVEAVIERDYAGWDTIVVDDHLDFE